MNRIELVIYLIGLTENMRGFNVIAVMIVLLSIVCLIPIQVVNDESLKKLIPICLKAIKLGIAMMAIAFFVPSQKTAYMMLGAHLGKEAIQSETAQKIQKIIDGKLDEYIKELESKK